jgi:hypothetical protein
MPFMAQLLPVTAFSIDFSPLPADIPPWFGDSASWKLMGSNSILGPNMEFELPKFQVRRYIFPCDPPSYRQVLWELSGKSREGATAGSMRMRVISRSWPKDWKPSVETRTTPD